MTARGLLEGLPVLIQAKTAVGGSAAFVAEMKNVASALERPPSAAQRRASRKEEREGVRNVERFIGRLVKRLKERIWKKVVCCGSG